MNTLSRSTLFPKTEGDQVIIDGCHIDIYREDRNVLHHIIIGGNMTTYIVN